MFQLTVSRFFGHFGRQSTVLRPRGIEGIDNIHIGDGVYVAAGGLFAAVPLTGAEKCELKIGDGCKIGANNHFYATRSVVLEDQVLTASNVYVADNSHKYTDPTQAISNQPIQQLENVRIGEGTWLGQNVCIIGVTIGRGCVIGANAVVLDHIPDYCVAVGAPARIVRRLDRNSGRWIRVHSQPAHMD